MCATAKLHCVIRNDVVCNTNLVGMDKSMDSNFGGSIEDREGKSMSRVNVYSSENKILVEKTVQLAANPREWCYNRS